MSYFKKVVIGGFIVLVPIPILYFVFRWLFTTIVELIEPFTTFLLTYIEVPKLAADMLVFSTLILFCFFVGNFVQTRFGKFLHDEVEKKLLIKIPFYRMVKEILTHVFGEGKFLSCPVAIAEIFPGTEAIALVTAEHTDGRYTVFVPTAPNPTTGFVFCLPRDRVRILPGVTKETMFRTVIACGMGSEELLNRVQKNVEAPSL